MTGEPQIRMAYLISRYPAISHTFILREVQCLREQGFAIHVASINSPDRESARLTAEEQQEKAATYYVKQTGLRRVLTQHLAVFASSPISYFRGLRFAFALAGLDAVKLVYALFYFVEAVLVGGWMRQHGLTHLHVHFATPASTVGLVATKIFPVTLSITVHGPDEFYDTPGYRLAEKIAGSSFLCVIGKFAKSQLMKLSPVDQWQKFEVSPLGVDPALFSPQTFREHPAIFELICVGRLVPAKGQHVLVEAMALLVQGQRKVRLRLVGDGPDRDSLEALVCRNKLQEHVVFEGAVNQDRIRSLYAQGDAFVLPSFAEGIPVVLMEAMSIGIPCVTTCITGIPELIRDRREGLLVPPSDAEDLAGAIAELMDDPDLRRRLGAAGRERVIERYNLRDNVDRLATIFRRRLGKAA